MNGFGGMVSFIPTDNKFETSKKIAENKTPGEKLCMALQGMGTTFIKLGQFLATRPDIIGEELARDLEKLQDKVPAFELHDAKKIIKKEIGDNYFKDIVEISEPIAAASIAQVHLAKIRLANKEKEVAIKILRPEIEKLFNLRRWIENLENRTAFQKGIEVPFKLDRSNISQESAIKMGEKILI